MNDFNRDGRVYRVQMQSDAQFRAHPEDLRDVYVRSKSGAMIPLTAIATVNETTGPDFIERFNLFPSARLFGGPAPGYSSGQALAAMEDSSRRKACPTATRSRGPASRSRRRRAAEHARRSSGSRC